jgi:two-component system nitrogen regulation response regulator GlnG
MSDATTLMPPPAAGARVDGRLALTILYHPDIGRVGERALLAGDTELSRTQPVFDSGHALDDRYVSRSPVRITERDGGVTLDGGSARCAANGRALAGAAGAAWQTFDRSMLSRGVVLELADRVVVLLHLVTSERAERTRGSLVGGSDAIAQVRADIARVADLDVPVLLRGETGSGKELVARAIHDAGARSRPFVAVNVAAIPPTTAASELFGHARGAFTGAAHDHEGLFARADGGTLFLDEIGEAPADVQPMMLRVLETSEVTPLGSTKSRKVTVRLIAATDADLETQISEAGFRAALFHRLAGYQLFIPPLRERRDDIGRLLVHFLRIELAATGDLARLEGQRDAQRLWLPAALVGRLARYGWPGNVRQLRNAARQLAISSRGADEARIDSALERLLAVAPAAAPAPIPQEPPRRDPAAITDDDLLAALRASAWRAAGAAAQLGVSRSTLYQLIDRSKRIRKAKDIPEPELRQVYEACSSDLDAAAAELEVSRRALKLRISELGWDD